VTGHTRRLRAEADRHAARVCDELLDQDAGCPENPDAFLVVGRLVRAACRLVAADVGRAADRAWTYHQFAVIAREAVALRVEPAEDVSEPWWPLVAAAVRYARLVGLVRKKLLDPPTPGRRRVNK
jgi:hypothetical protein